MTFDEASKLIKRGDIIRLRQALEDGLNPDLSNQHSWSLLMIAALEGNTSIGTLLIDRGATLDSRNKFRETALSLEAHSGHPPFVQLLLSRGASLKCYPFGNNFDDWLNWVAKYGRSPEQAEHVRRLFDSERKLRSESNTSQAS